MMTYVTAFIFYTLAMIGILLIGFVVYKKTFVVNKRYGKGMIKVIDSLPIGNKKTLLILKIKNEKFLVASGAEHTTFLAKLDDNDNIELNENTIQENIPIKALYNEEVETEKKNRFDDMKKHRAAEIQKQFKELYSKEEPQVIPQIPQNDLTPEEAQRRQELVKKFLKNMNLDARGANFNG